jgi:hypothetical protein
MMIVSPVISRETTMWRVWVGFNATHSFGLILFGALYGYLAIRHSVFLFHSWFLLALGFALLLGYAVIARPLRRFTESCWRRFSTFLESSSTWHSRSPDNCFNAISITTRSNPEPLLCRTPAQIRFSAKGIRASRQVF